MHCQVKQKIQSQNLFSWCWGVTTPGFSKITITGREAVWETAKIFPNITKRIKAKKISPINIFHVPFCVEADCCSREKAEKGRAGISGVICHFSIGKHTKWHRGSRNLTSSVHEWVNSYSCKHFWEVSSRSGLWCSLSDENFTDQKQSS